MDNCVFSDCNEPIFKSDASWFESIGIDCYCKKHLIQDLLYCINDFNPDEHPALNDMENAIKELVTICAKCGNKSSRIFDDGVCYDCCDKNCDVSDCDEPIFISESLIFDGYTDRSHTCEKHLLAGLMFEINEYYAGYNNGVHDYSDINHVAKAICELTTKK